MQPPRRLRRQQGIMLVEMMTGLVVGLLVTLTAMAMLALVQVHASVQGDTARLQQRADVALQSIGAQLRQAGAIELQASGIADSVHFSSAYNTIAVSGDDGITDTLRITHQLAPGARDCLGNEPDPGKSGPSVGSRFSVVGGQLRCLGSDTQTGAQVIADQVEDFQIRYGTRSNSALGLKFRDEDASTIGSRWGEVSVVRVCLQIVGELRQSKAPVGAQHDCQGRTLQPDGRMRRIVQASFHLRNAAPS